MADQHATGRLDDIRVDHIDPNPENPRLTFRQGELDELQESIRVYGIQVPISVYKDGSRYVLIDGERRWRCSSKLNRKTIPALVQERPTPLQNLLLMFNIHALREQWDYLTIAMKLPHVISLLKKDRKKDPTEAELSGATGLTRGQIRRCKLLMEIPDHYKTLLLRELQKPKPKQRLSEDLLIEMERALKTVRRALPNAVQDPDAARDMLIKKYTIDGGGINAVTDFRKLAKIGRAENVGVDGAVAERAIRRLISDDSYSIDDAFEDTVSGVYAERDIVSRIEALIARLEAAPEEVIDDDVREKLEELIKRARSLLEDQT